DVGVPPKIEVGEVSDGLLGSLGGNFAHPDEASERLGDLDVDQMRRVEFVIVSEQACLDTHAKSSLEEKLCERRGVDHDHADSRSSRMTTAAGVFNVTGIRPWSRASISSRVGRAAMRASSASKKSESDCPATAARAFSFRCRASGTFRTWIIFAMFQACAHVNHMS